MRRQASIEGRELIGMLALCMALGAMSIDLLLPAFPEVRAWFGLTVAAPEVSRAITAFLVGAGAGQLAFGPLSDRFGRKPVLHASLVVYVAGAAASVLADSLGAFVACRVVWGIGAAGPNALATAMLRDVFGVDRMARAMSQVAGTFLLVPVLAPALATGILLLGDWRLVVLVPIGSAALLAGWTAVRLPETLAPERRRPLEPRALVLAATGVVTSRPTVAHCLAATFLFGIMASYVGSAQVIVDDVFGRGSLFPVVFGAIAVGLAGASLLAARVVARIGLERLLRTGTAYVLGASSLLAFVSLAWGGRPPMWLYVVASLALLPAVSALIPNCNTAAMAPLPHIAGTAAAMIGTTSIVGGSLLGSVVDTAYDRSVLPFSLAALCFAAAATACVRVASRPLRRRSAGGVAEELLERHLGGADQGRLLAQLAGGQLDRSGQAGRAGLEDGGVDRVPVRGHERGEVAAEDHEARLEEGDEQAQATTEPRGDRVELGAVPLQRSAADLGLPAAVLAAGAGMRARADLEVADLPGEPVRPELHLTVGDDPAADPTLGGEVEEVTATASGAPA
jgi:DHA1 family bicyclomycin/chloramphenicol resistance-like MFS transporter